MVWDWPLGFSWGTTPREGRNEVLGLHCLRLLVAAVSLCPLQMRALPSAEPQTWALTLWQASCQAQYMSSWSVCYLVVAGGGGYG